MKRNIRIQPTPAMKTFSRIFSGVFALVGIGFVTIGVTEVIPSGGGAFGMVWTLMACCFTGIGIYGAANKNGLYGMQRGFGLEITDEETGDESAEERLKKLQALYDQRLITAEEYETKRKEILREL